jgi:predicted DNA-binding transcriptional regulator AlpA
MFLTIDDLAAELKTDHVTVSRLVAEGAVPVPVYIGGLVRWPRVEIKRWVSEGCPREEAPPPRDTLDLVRAIGDETIARIRALLERAEQREDEV